MYKRFYYDINMMGMEERERFESQKSEETRWVFDPSIFKETKTLETNWINSIQRKCILIFFCAKFFFLFLSSQILSLVTVNQFYTHFVNNEIPI